MKNNPTIILDLNLCDFSREKKKGKQERATGKCMVRCEKQEQKNN